MTSQAPTATSAASDATQPTPAARLAGLRPYQPPEAKPYIDLVLDANEGPIPAAPIASLLNTFDPATLRRYPSTAELEHAIADRHAIDPARVVVTNGADDAIDRICRAVLEPGRELAIHTPTFEMIERSARLAGGSVAAVPWMQGPFPAADLIAAITPRTALLAIVTPNNPTGSAVPTDDLLRVAAAAAEHGALLLADLAYIEFADQDPTPRLLEQPNIAITRTFSKALGLASARVGYAIAPTEVADWLRTVGGPYPISATSAALAQAALAGDTTRDVYIEQVRRERATLEAVLQELNAAPLPSQANFLTADFSRSNPGGAAFVHRALASLGISVRALATKPGLEQILRITLPGDAAQFERLTHALRTALDPQAIVIDSDVAGQADIADLDMPIPVLRQTETQPARCWLITATPERVTAARRDGLVPFALTPTSSPTDARAALAEAGVAACLDSIQDIRNNLP